MQHFVIASSFNVRQHAAKDELKIDLLPKWTLVEELKVSARSELAKSYGKSPSRRYTRLGIQRLLAPQNRL